MNQAFEGGCLCGALRYRAEAFESEMAHCHCSMCRKFHGAAFATFASVPRTAFQWLSGEDVLQGYEAANGTVRSFCRNCGSSLTFFSPRADPAFIELALATLDTEPPITPNAHIYVGSGAAWARPCDGLPQYEAGRAGPCLKA